MASTFITFILLIAFQQSSCFVLEPTESSGFLPRPSGFCKYFAQVNCSQHGSGSLCGSNGVTYTNHCHFTKAHCSNRELTIKQTGPCQNERVKQEIVLSLVCNDILAMDCSMYHGTSAYCGTDGRSYNNVCEFEKARCHSNRLFLNHLGYCRTSRGDRRVADIEE